MHSLTRTRMRTSARRLNIATLPVGLTTAMPYSISVGKPSLGSAPDEAAAKHHHVKASNGTTSSFQNPHASSQKSFCKHTFLSNSSRTLPPLDLPAEQPANAETRGQFDGSMRMPGPIPGEKLVPVQTPTFLPTRFASKELRTTWLGHASHYTEFPSGLRVLFDPVLEDRCSPFTFAGPKRYTRRACAIADLPFVDAVIISHSHYDHLSVATIKELKARFPDAHYFVGLGLASWFRASGITHATEMDWWEDAELTVTLDAATTGESTADSTADSSSPITAKISCLPSQHTSSRYGLDTDRTLWCSWAVTSTGAASTTAKSLYFGGDTGYRSVPQLPATEDDWGEKYAHLPTNPDFKHIGDLRGPFDLGLIPIGAYNPRYLFSWMHADPRDAVEIFRDTRCRRALGIHWGTWALTTEPVMEPPGRLRGALASRGVEEVGVFDVCDIGESRTF